MSGIFRRTYIQSSSSRCHKVQTSKHCSLLLVSIRESATKYVLMGSNETNLGQSCRDLYSSLSPLSSYHARILLHYSQDPEPIRLNVDERSYCVGKNDKDVKNLNGRN